MYKRLGVVTVGVVALYAALAIGLAGQGTSAELQLVTRSADALGGRDRVMAIKTLQIVGYGELAYMNGGGNISADPAAPQKWQKVLEYTRTIDLEHGRTRVQQRVKMDFVFASTAKSGCNIWLSKRCVSLDHRLACQTWRPKAFELMFPPV